MSTTNSYAVGYLIIIIYRLRLLSRSESSDSSYNCRIVYGCKVKIVNASLLNILCSSLLQHPVVPNTFSEAAVDEFLTYLNGKIIDITTYNVDKLKEIGNTYNMDNLNEECVKFIEYMKRYAGIILKNSVKSDKGEDTISYLLKLEGATFESEQKIYDCVHQHYKHLESKNNQNAYNWYNDLKKYINWRMIKSQLNGRFNSPIEYIDKHREYVTSMNYLPYFDTNVKYKYPCDILNRILPKDLTIKVNKGEKFEVNKEAMYYICKSISKFVGHDGVIRLNYNYDVVEFLLNIFNDKNNINCSDIGSFNQLCDLLNQNHLRITREIELFWCEASQQRIEM